MARGFFITIEGIEGCGKSTQARFLYDHLIREGIDSILTHEPGGTEAGIMIRDILLNSKTLSPYCELFLFMADRSQHVEEIINPALLRGAIVICDRYYHSTFAYQSGGRGINSKVIENLNDLAVNEARPDLTFYIDIPPEIGLSRKNSASLSLDRIEKEELDFHRQVREAFKNMALSCSNIVLIDGDRGIEEVGREIIDIFFKKFNKTG